MACYVCCRETVLNRLVAYVPCNINAPYECGLCSAVVRHIHEARAHINDTHLPPIDYVVVYPWNKEQADAITARDMTIFMQQVLLSALPLAPGQLVHIGENTLDPMGARSARALTSRSVCRCKAQIPTGTWRSP